MSGNFVVFQQQKKHAILLSEDQPPRAFAVWAHRATFESLGQRAVPFVVSTLLLPWEGIITYDGVLTCPRIALGEDALQVLNQRYREARAHAGLSTSLPVDSTSIESSESTETADCIYQIKVTLRGSRPPSGFLTPRRSPTTSSA